MSRNTTLAKINRPRLFGVVPRERLFALFDDNRGRPLVWISGPPGAGKTALVGSYLEDRGFPEIWYQIDSGDADPAALFHYLTLAAESAAKSDSIVLPRFVPEHLGDLASFSRLFFRAFFSQVPEGLILVLDNYQEAPVDALLHEIMHHALAEVPPDSSVFGISRVEAPRGFIKSAANGSMFNLGWDGLQLTLDEVRDIAARRCVTDHWLLKMLHQQSQGWAAGITLMLERLGHFDGKSNELPAETRESVFNYFASLIFDQASEETRHILLSIAFLPRVTSSLAVDLSGHAEASVLLEDLYRRRMFTDRRTGAESIYQFHTLFRDFLRTRAKATLTQKYLDSLLQRSALALENAGESDAAMEIWIEAQSWDEAVRVILKGARDLLNSGRRQTLLRWIQNIPESEQLDEPWLIYWLGSAQLQIGPELGVKTLQHALQQFSKRNDSQGRIECLLALLDGAFLGFHALDAMNLWLDDLLNQVKISSDSVPADVELRTWGVLCVTLFHVRPWHPLMETAYRRVEELLPHCSDGRVALAAAMHALVVSGLCGDFGHGHRVLKATESLAMQDTASPSEAAWWFAQVGWLRFVEARYEEALHFLERGCRIAEANDLRAMLRQILLWRYTVEWRAVGWTAANATLAKVEALPKSNQPMTEAQLCLFKSRWITQCGRKDEAANLALLSQAAANRTGSRLEELIFCLSNSDVLLDAGRIEDAKPLLLQSRKLTEQIVIYDCWRAAQLFMEAWMAYKEDDVGRTLGLLRQSLSLAGQGSQRYYLRFSDWAMPPLFRLALEEGIEVDLVQDVIRSFGLNAPKDAPDLWPWPVRIFTMGRFEVQVHGKPLEFPRKLPRKALLLLKAIVAHSGRAVSEQVLCDGLWGDEEGDAARNALSITVVRLRKLLGKNESILQQGGKVALNPELCWVDSWVFEARLADPESTSRKILNLYGGTFLPEDESEPWSVAPRERLRGKFIDALSRHGAVLEAEGDLPGAVQCYLRGIDADPIVESFHLGLMRCYEQLDKRTEAFSVYRRFRQTLSVVLGVPPSDVAQQLFEEMLERQSEALTLPVPDSGISPASNVKQGIVAKVPLRRTR